MTREEAVHLVQLLMDGGTSCEAAEDDSIIEALQLGLRCPHIIDYIFHPAPGPEPTAEQVVDRAMAYRPITL
ncbi:e9imm peptide [Streptomyces sp. NPDC058290]|uniref:e9imm peptide n=1 Tax=Streptomyces sp. NPDC058290 TaxID=3346426 RepID=UPI0036E051A1